MMMVINKETRKETHEQKTWLTGELIYSLPLVILKKLRKKSSHAIILEHECYKEKT